METKIKRIDAMEAEVEFTGTILISYNQKSDFEKDLFEIIDKYAI